MHHDQGPSTRKRNDFYRKIALLGLVQQSIFATIPMHTRL